MGMHTGAVAMQPMTAAPGGMFPGVAQPHPFWGHPTGPLHPSGGMLPQRFATHPMPYSMEVRTLSPPLLGTHSSSKNSLSKQSES